MYIHLKSVLAGRSLPSQKAWISVDWKRLLIMMFAVCAIRPALAMEEEVMDWSAHVDWDQVAPLGGNTSDEYYEIESALDLILQKLERLIRCICVPSLPCLTFKSVLDYTSFEDS